MEKEICVGVEQMEAKLKFVWVLSDKCIAKLQIGAFEWRLDFAKSAARWLKEQVGNVFPARRVGHKLEVNMYGYDDPCHTCWLEVRNASWPCG